VTDQRLKKIENDKPPVKKNVKEDINSLIATIDTRLTEFEKKTIKKIEDTIHNESKKMNSNIEKSYSDVVKKNNLDHVKEAITQEREDRHKEEKEKKSKSCNLIIHHLIEHHF